MSSSLTIQNRHNRVRGWSRGESNPCSPPCKVRATFAADYRIVLEIRLNKPNSALDGPCYCRQMSSLTAPTAATLLPLTTRLQKSSLWICSQSKEAVPILFTELPQTPAEVSEVHMCPD